MRDNRPSCTIDWRREFTLPVAVPPETVPLAEARTWALVIDAAADNLLSTFDRFHTKAPRGKQVRETPVSGVAAATVILPRITAAPALSAEVDLPGTLGVVKRTFQTKPPASGTREVVESELQSSITHDAISRGFAPLPIPFANLDTLRVFYAVRADAGFTGTFGINEVGPIKEDGTFPVALPTLLLRTATDPAGTKLGELDRLVLRSPISGRFRFEPYLIYRKEGAALHALGPSNTGRVTIQQPRLSTREQQEKTDTQVYKQRVFAFEHVDRGSVATVIDQMLALQLAWLEQIVAHFGGAKNDHPRLTIPKSSPELLMYVLSGVNNLLRAWLAFLFSIRWGASDVTVAGAIPADWAKKLPIRDAAKKDAAGIIEVLKGVLGDAGRRASLRWFSSMIYTKRLAGFTWSEVLVDAGQDPEVLRFPVPGDAPPYTPHDVARAKQYDLLRLVDDPRYRWVACYAGAPVGRPSAVFAPAPAVGTAFPANGLSTYELEALHAACTSGAALGLGAQPTHAGPRPGYAMDLTPYAAKATGHACYLSAERLPFNSLHTFIDFLIELTQGIHFRSKELPFVDIHALIDPSRGHGHPLREPLHSNDWLHACFLRLQMDDLKATTLGEDSFNWWTGKLSIGGALSPENPFKHDKTNPRRFSGQLAFADVFPLPVGTEEITGFDEFDIMSAMLATQRMSQPPVSPPLPLPVLLALMDREGVRIFGSVNRHVRNTTAATKTLTWEALFRNPAEPAAGPEPRGWWPGDDGAMARKAWLAYPYGLDTFAVQSTDTALNGHLRWVSDAGVLALESDEDPGAYIRARVHSTWLAVSSAVGLPVIWKRSRRVHWACLSLMAGWFRMLESDMHAAAAGSPRPYHESTKGFVAGKPTASWLPAGSSPPSLVHSDGSRVGPNDVEWKDYLTYYGMIYIMYNGTPKLLVDMMDAVDTALTISWAHTKRDYLVFKYARGNEVIERMASLIIGLDAYLRLNMSSKVPAEYPGAAPDTTAALAARWGIL